MHGPNQDKIKILTPNQDASEDAGPGKDTIDGWGPDQDVVVRHGPGHDESKGHDHEFGVINGGGPTQDIYGVCKSDNDATYGVWTQPG